MSVMGTRVVRIEDQKLITSGGVYVDDLRESLLDGAAHAVFVRSPLAHARILGVDTAAAREAPGVVGVFTAADLDITKTDEDPRTEPWLASDKVRYVGEPLAVIVEYDRPQISN